MSNVFSFMRWRFLFFAISLMFLIPGVVSLARFGLRPSIDFTGGSLLEVKVDDPSKIVDLSRERVQEAIGSGYELSAVQQSGDNQVILRGKAIPNDVKNGVMHGLELEWGKIEELRFETVGPVLGRETLTKAITAAAIVSVVILLYVWRQFHSMKYGVSAILAMFHDSLILLGAFSILGQVREVEVDVLFVTALLTTLSFSIHDTIVVFDRIREIRRKNLRLSFREIADAAVLETLGRSINNSLTIIIMLLALVLLGGDTIRWFATALLIGAVTGTYSSTFTAVPLVVVWDELEKRRPSAPVSRP